MKPFIKLNIKDNVAIALKNLKQDTELQTDNGSIVLTEDISRGHKFALQSIAEGEEVLKYGHPIGHAEIAILRGAHVHSHNLSSNFPEPNYAPQLEERMGILMDREVKAFHRKNWDIGIRNELWIVPTVGSVNQTAQHIKARFLDEINRLEADGVHVLEHHYGSSQTGSDLDATRSMLQSIVLHPNAGGVLVLSLGTESNDLKTFKETLGDYDEKRIRFMTVMEQTDEIGAGAEILHELHNKMKTDYRSTSLLRNLKIGIAPEVLGSFSQMTVNPLLSGLSDYIIKSGGSVVLSDSKQLKEAAPQLATRSVSEAVYNKFLQLLTKEEAGFELPEGISTGTEQSLSYVKKAGTSNIVEVLDYSQRLNKHGLHLLKTPKDERLSVTAIGAAGCQMVIFPTENGTPFGGFIPTIKMASTTELANKKPNWMDYDAEASLFTTPEEALEGFINYICDIANGKWTQNEYNDYREIGILRTGITI